MAGPAVFPGADLFENAAELVSLLQSWMDEEDAGEQRYTGEYLVRALDGDRLSDRRFFPQEHKGLTW